jgi:hypothetical protein
MIGNKMVLLQLEFLHETAHCLTTIERTSTRHSKGTARMIRQQSVENPRSPYILRITKNRVFWSGSLEDILMEARLDHMERTFLTFRGDAKISLLKTLLSKKLEGSPYEYPLRLITILSYQMVCCP